MNGDYEYLRELHEYLLRMMVEFRQICEKLNINFYLAGGTLLGAVRHQGFIPWDDDVDLAMFRNDYNTLISYFKDKEIEGYSLSCYQTNPDNELLFGKLICHKPVPESLRTFCNSDGHITIDILPVDSCSSKKSMKKAINAYRIKALKGIAKSKKYYSLYKDAGLKLTPSKFFRVVIGYLFKIIDTKKIIGVAVDIAEKGYDKNSKCTVAYMSKYNHKRETHLRSDWEPGVLLKFEDQFFLAPVHYEIILKTTYGDDWNVIPDEKNRIQHKH